MTRAEFNLHLALEVIRKDFKNCKKVRFIRVYSNETEVHTVSRNNDERDISQKQIEKECKLQNVSIPKQF